MKSYSGKHKLIEQLKDEAAELRQWMYDHSTPSTPASEFEVVANKYAIIQTRLYVIEKHW